MLTVHDYVNIGLFVSASVGLVGLVGYVLHALYRRRTSQELVELQIKNAVQLRDMRRKHRKEYYQQLNAWKQHAACEADDPHCFSGIIHALESAIDKANYDIVELNNEIVKLRLAAPEKKA